MALDPQQENMQPEQAQMPQEEGTQAEELTPEQLAEKAAADVPEEFKEAFTKVVAAGMKVMYSDETHELMLDELEGEGPLEQRMGEAIAGLMRLLYEKSNQAMPTEVIIPAATYLLAKGVSFLKKVTGEALTPEVLGAATDIMVQSIMQNFGIDPAKFSSNMEEAAAKGAAIEQGGGAPTEGPGPAKGMIEQGAA